MWSAHHEMLWDMANTNPNLSVLSVLHSKHDLEYHNTVIGRCLLKGNIHLYINPGSGSEQKKNKTKNTIIIQRQKSQLKENIWQ